jgi:hypothetical protein
MIKIEIKYTLEVDQSVLDTEEINEKTTLKFTEDVTKAFKEKFKEKFKSFKGEYKEIEDGNK